MTDYRKIAKEALWVYLLTMLIIPSGFLVRILYAHNLSIIDYGLFYGLFAFFGFFGFVRDWGLSSATYFYANNYIIHGQKNKIKTLFFLNHGFKIILSALIGVGMYLFRGIITSGIFKNEGNIGYIFDIFIIFWVITTICKSNYIFFNIFQEQRISKFLEFLNWFLIIILSLIGFQLYEAYKVPVVAYLIAMVVVCVLSMLIFSIKHNDLFKNDFYKGSDLGKEVLKYASAVVIGGFSTMVLAHIDLFLIQLMIGAEKVAYYSSGFALASLLMMIVTPLTIIIQPLFSKIWHQNNKEELSKLISFILNNILIFILPFSLFCFTFAVQIITLVYGSNFIESVIILKLFSFSFIIKVINSILFLVLWSIGKPKQSSKILIIAGVLNVTLDVLLISVMGNVGAVIATSFCYLLMMVLCLREILKEIDIKFNISEITKILLSSLAFLIIAFTIKGKIIIFDVGIDKINFLLNGGIVFGIALIVYTICLLLLGVITKEKIEIVRSLFNLRFKKKNR
ncbi:oligosaccharide flippase family protein [Candidatus Woesearchaeota archaeon]|jgi:O-antigen/teichoic acid export membrane protein|nr:oligosaccharide flippase family protein [Candidatus Woesearchaeota archaeon]